MPNCCSNNPSDVERFNRWLSEIDNNFDGLLTQRGLHGGPISPDQGGGVAPVIKGVVAEGDSITKGNGIAPSWPAKIAGSTQLPVANRATNGKTLSTIDGAYATNVAPFYSAETGNLLTLLAGTNDLQNGTTAATLQTLVASFMNKAKATGFRRLVCTVLPRNDTSNGWNGTKDAQRVTYNTWLRANWQTIAEVFCDLDVVSELSNPDNTTYYTADKLHPNAAGFAVIAASVQQALGLANVAAPAPSVGGQAQVTWGLTGTGIALSNGNRDMVKATGSFPSARASAGATTGKLYIEMKLIALSSTASPQIGLGLCTSDKSLNGHIGATGTGSGTMFWLGADNFYLDEFVLVEGIDSGINSALNDVWMMAADLDVGKLWFGRNGYWFNGGDPVRGINNQESFTPGGATWYFGATSDTIGDKVQIPAVTAYAPPVGFQPVA